MNLQRSRVEPHAAKLTVEDFLLLDRAGAFDRYSRTELIDGVVYVMSPQHAEHFTLKNLLYRRLADACDALGTGLEAWSEGSIDMSPHSVPEPDIFVTNERPVKGLTRLDTVVLAIEVSTTTLSFDLGEKARIYGMGGLPEYWVVDVEGGVVHQMWASGPEGYGERREVAWGERIEAVTVEGLAAETDGICIE